MKRVLLAAALLTLHVCAADWETTVSGFPSQIIVPSSSTLVAGAPTVTAPQHLRVEKVLLANTSGNVVTVSVTDNSTNCSGAACQLVPNITLQANQVVTISLGNVPAVGGVKWYASAGNAVHGWMNGSNY